MRPLIDLIRAIPDTPEYSPEAATFSITNITSDSRRVMNGSLFVAIKGKQYDGTQFIHDAKASGASAVLCGMDTEVKERGIATVRAANPRKALAHMAAAFYGSQPEHVVAITGTDGKTSTADFYRQFWQHLRKSPASIGTLGVLRGDGSTLHAGSHTTPDPICLHKILAGMTGQGITHVAMEASSHGLDQYRLDAVKLDAAAFTNIARDHLDYHKTEDAYFTAKSRLFSELLQKGATAVLNQDDARFAALKTICDTRGIKVIGFGRSGAQYRLVRLMPHAHGQMAELKINGHDYRTEIPLVGAFQAMNILAALGLVTATGGALEQALAVIPHFKGVPGRLEQVVRLTNGASVYIDYAHTPMALANVLETLKPHTKGKLHVVFGCGGDRDAGKRSEMGKVADRLADDIIITDDNPRSENPASIRKTIMEACPRGKEVADRREAIYVALKRLKASDILVIAGKGHEKTQIIGSKTIAFDDAEVAREGARELQLAA